MTTNSITTAPVNQALALPDALDIARDALTRLWNMLQDEQGNPLSPEANECLLAIYDHYELIAAAQQQSEARVAALLDTLKAARQQRDDALDLVETARDNGAKGAVRKLLFDLQQEFDVKPETSRTALDMMTGVATDLPYYVRNTLRKAFDLIEEELDELRDQNEEDATLGDPEDDYDEYE